ncbi:MAG: type II toxin-antitoxin system HicA family toxin [Methanothrix sp.]
MRHPDGRSTVVPVHPREEIGRGLLMKMSDLRGKTEVLWPANEHDYTE